MDKRLIWFEALYDTHADAIWRHFYHRLGDHERAKELMQDVFMKTWEYVLRGNQIEHEKAFLYRTAHNLFVNEIRSKKLTLSYDLLAEDGFEIEDVRDTTSKHAEHTELLDRLQHIKESYRTVLVMRYIDELPVKEIAAILYEKETNISMRIKRGLTALKQTYQTPSP